MYLDLHWAVECERSEVNYFVKPIFVVAVVIRRCRRCRCVVFLSFFFCSKTPHTFRIEETNYHASLIFYCAAHVHVASMAHGAKNRVGGGGGTRIVCIVIVRNDDDDDDTLKRMLYTCDTNVLKRKLRPSCYNLLFIRQLHSPLSNVHRQIILCSFHFIRVVVRSTKYI